MPEAGREDSNKGMVEIGYSGMGEVWQELSRGEEMRKVQTSTEDKQIWVWAAAWMVPPSTTWR